MISPPSLEEFRRPRNWRVRARSPTCRLVSLATLKIDPGNDSAYVDLGFCYGLLRDAKTAEDMYRAATLINPSPANFKELADVYLRTGNAEAALMAANAGLLKEPHSAKLLNAKGLALNDLQRSDEAKDAFRQAIRYDPSLEVARQNLEAIGGKRSR